MRSIRKRISIGFISLALILFFAGGISVNELNSLRDTTKTIIEASTRSAEIAKRMLNALQLQNSAILRMIILGNSTPNDDYHEGIIDFNIALGDATQTIGDRSDLEEIYSANENYRNIVAEHSEIVSTTENKDWFLNSYLAVYYALNTAIKNYMTSPQSSLATRTELLEDSVYRTITPSILTLVIAMLIVLMFYFFVDSYYVKPLLSINTQLGLYLKSKIPFNVKIKENNELQVLKESVEQLIDRTKNKE